MNRKNRPRIGIDFHGWTGIYQGSRSHLFGIYSRAVKLAPELDFYFLAEEPERLREIWDVSRLPNVRFVPMARGHGLVRLFVRLPMSVLRHRLDLLHAQYRIPPFMTSRTVVTIHDVLFEEYPQFFTPFFTFQSKLFFRHAARTARQVLTVSEYSRRELARCYGIPAERIVVTPNGVNLERFNSIAGVDDAEVLRRFGLGSGNYVLSVGRLEPRKNYPTMIRAFRQSNRTDLTFAIVGQRDFSYGDALREAEDARKAGFRVAVLENVDDEALPVLMRNAIVFMYLAYAEGFGMPPLEAMACGTPVIASNTTALPEVVGDAGLLVDPSSSDEAAGALTSLLADKALRDRLSLRARDRAAQFTWQRSAENLVTAFRSLVRA